jgi:hypothetical protein
MIKPETGDVMEYRKPGHSGLLVSQITLGTLTFTGKTGFDKTGNVSDSQARHFVDNVYDYCVNMIDTSAGVPRRCFGKYWVLTVIGLSWLQKHAAHQAKGRMTAEPVAII